MFLFATLALENLGSSRGSLLLWTFGTLLGVVFLIRTYQGIFRRSERRVVWWLLALRASGLAALWLALARPVWTGTTENIEPGRVAMIVDNSLSMTLPDASGENRWKQTRVAAEKLRDAIMAASGPKMQVDLHDISGRPLPDGLPTEPTIERTDYGRALDDVLARLRGTPLTGVILLGDGMDNSGLSDFRDFGSLPVPVHTVWFAAMKDAENLDLEVRSPKAPTRAMVGNEVQIEVPVVKTGGPATEAKVALKRGSEILTQQSISFATGSSEQTVTLKFTPSQAGQFVFTVAAEAALPEPLLINNSRSFPIQIDGEPIRVFYLEGAMRWEYRYLRERLEADPDIRLMTVLRRVNPESVMAKGGREALTAEKLKTLDIVILGDLESDFLSNPEYDALAKWLEQKDHSLLLLGGYRSFGVDGWRKSPLANLLPVVFTETEPYQLETPFVPRLTDDAKRHPIFDFGGDRLKSTEMFEENARLDGMSLLRRVKPGTTVLLDHPTLKIEDAPAVVACWSNVGSGGRILILTADTTWQWSRSQRLIGRPDTLYARFWSQSLRWLAGRTADENRPLLSITTDRTGYESGKLVTVNVSRFPRPDVDLSRAEMNVEVKSPDGSVKKLEVQASSTNPDEFRGMLTPATGGRFEISASLRTSDGKPLGNQTAEFLVQGSALELSDPRTNPRIMEEIARLTGGNAVEISQAITLVEKIALKERKRAKTERHEYGNSPLLFVFFLAVITAEWFMRRRHQMV